MSLDRQKLENLRELANGITQARCPACAEGGHDRTGEHLRIYPDGRFGCCVFPKDKEHRKRIFALAGKRSEGKFHVKVGVWRLPLQPPMSVTASLAAFGTLGTPVSESVPPVAETQDKFGTLGTPISMSRAYAREDKHVVYMCKDNERGVPSVPRPAGGRMPHFTAGGTLVIPFDSPERFHWWKPGGQSVADTIAELRRGEATKGKEDDGTHI